MVIVPRIRLVPVLVQVVRMVVFALTLMMALPEVVVIEAKVQVEISLLIVVLSVTIVSMVVIGST